MEPPERRCLALVDVNNCYVSCERLMRPDLERTPMVILSNNDGVCVSRSAEVKALGSVPMGTPWHKMKNLARQHGILAMSSNYELYGDMSRRFHGLLATWVPPHCQEIYSIDESFLDFGGQRIDRTATGHAIKRQVQQWLGLPVCVGFGGSTKTLAKFANHVAKKRPEWQGVCDLTALSAEERLALLDQFEAKDVWGIGRRLSEQLKEHGIHTAGDLARCDPKRARERWGVVMERTINELNGVSCIAWEDEPPTKQQIISSRSFGGPVYTVDELADPVRMHVGRAAEKLRAQGSVAGRLGVFITTNAFRPQDPQYSPIRTIRLAVPTDDTATLTVWAVQILKSIFRPYRFVKAGVMLDDLRPKSVMQGSLFDALPSEQDMKREKLMGVMDKANGKWGRGSLGIGSAGVKGERDWSMQRGMLSPRYTTRWNELREIS
ncbi:Y-family DNA polymerase [Dyella sp. 2HG41-7]|uniref:Y-family DNA polymerase n=1 Tax=Dyella sp. 2HG41-7 TaxID=2883239 RepID=UPI001F1E1EE0|nr:Y-family DNA polymerase [Dyella sp. 2HG41-7]